MIDIQTCMFAYALGKLIKVDLENFGYVQQNAYCICRLACFQYGNVRPGFFDSIRQFLLGQLAIIAIHI